MTNPSELRWVRSNDGIVAGVAKGLAKALGVEPWVVRILFLFTGATGIGIVLYLMLVIALPRAGDPEAQLKKMILGVCLEIHRRGDMELGLARFVALGLLLMSSGAAIVGYLVLYVIFKDKR